MAKSADSPRLSLISETNRLDPPAGLGEAGRALWIKVQREYVIDDIGGRAVPVPPIASRASSKRSRLMGRCSTHAPV
jgi:hypothetical protein